MIKIYLIIWKDEIPAIVERLENKIVVKIALRMNRRVWISRLCDRIETEYMPAG